MRIPKDGRTIKLNQGSIVSLFAFGKVEEIQTSGLAYGFDNQNLEPGTRGIHNEAISDEVFVKCGTGELVMLDSVWSKSESPLYREIKCKGVSDNPLQLIRID